MAAVLDAFIAKLAVITFAIVVVLFTLWTGFASAVIALTVFPDARMVTSAAAHLLPVIMSKTWSPSVMRRLVNCPTVWDATTDAASRKYMASVWRCWRSKSSASPCRYLISSGMFIVFHFLHCLRTWTFALLHTKERNSALCRQ